MGKIVSSFLIAVYRVLDVAELLLFVRAILSWFPNLSSSKIYYFTCELTEPLIEPIRKLLSKTKLAYSMIDFPFLITFFVMILIQEVIIALGGGLL